jgi:hypothetical protein
MFSSALVSREEVVKKNRTVEVPHNKSLQPTALVGKHFAKMKSKLLTNESCG